MITFMEKFGPVMEENSRIDTFTKQFWLKAEQGCRMQAHNAKTILDAIKWM